MTSSPVRPARPPSRQLGKRCTGRLGPSTLILLIAVAAAALLHLLRPLATTAGISQLEAATVEVIFTVPLISAWFVGLHAALTLIVSFGIFGRTSLDEDGWLRESGVAGNSHVHLAGVCRVEGEAIMLGIGSLLLTDDAGNQFHLNPRFVYGRTLQQGIGTFLAPRYAAGLVQGLPLRLLTDAGKKELERACIGSRQKRAMV